MAFLNALNNILQGKLYGRFSYGCSVPLKMLLAAVLFLSECCECKADCAHWFGITSTARASNTGNTNRNISTTITQCALRHFASHLCAHGAKFFEAVLAHLQAVYFSGIAIGNKTTIKPI